MNSTLRELQIELKRTLTTDAMITVIENKLNNPSTTNVEAGQLLVITSEIVIFILGKVMAKVMNTRQQNDWVRFRQVCLDITQRADTFELFLALRYLLGTQSSIQLESPTNGAQAQTEMVQTERSKELLLDILKPCFFDFDEWAVELIESSIAQSMDPGETLE